MERKLLFIVNPRAGRRKSHAPLYDAIAVFCRAGYLVSVYSTAGPGDATRQVKAVGNNYSLVVCYGGDGTLNETVNGLMQLENPPALGYIPAGSTNDFAASLGLSSDAVTAAKAIVSGRERLLDVGRFNGRHFVYVASFGAFTKASYSAPQSTKNMLGHSAYILEGLKDLSTLRPYSVRVEADGETLDGSYLFGSISNSTSLGGIMRLAPEQVVPDDGKFELLLIKTPQTPLELQNLVTTLLSQDYSREGHLLRHVSRVQVSPKGSLPWSLDGEYEPGCDTVCVENLPRQLRFCM